MDYHLHRNGANQGIFPLEELRRRRAAGELSGNDLVWREGMAGWASLDYVLGTGASGASGAPPPIAAPPVRRRNRVLVWVLAAVGVVIILGVTVVGVIAVKFARAVRQGMQAAVRTHTSPQGVSVGSQAIETGTNSFTEADVQKRRREFRIRQYVEGYRKNGLRGQPCDAEALQFIESWIAQNYGGPTNLPPAQDLGEKLMSQPGCDDPLVVLAAGAICPELHEKVKRLERAVAGFEKSRHKAYPRTYACALLATELGSQNPRLSALDQAALQHFKEAFADGSFQPADEPEIADIILEGWGERLFARKGDALRAIAKEAKGYPWLALVLEGQYEVKEAWKARGSGWANSVSSQGWQGFSDHLAKARNALTEAWKAHPERPLAPALMIGVAMGDADAEEMRTWFDRAVAAQIDCPQAWSSIKWGLRPRWHGSHEAMLALGKEAVETGRFDTDVPRKFCDFVTDVESELELQPGEHIYGRPDIWPTMQRLYEGYIATPSEAGWRDGWRSTYAAVAYFAGAYDVARAQLEAVQWKPWDAKLTGWGKDMSLLPQEVAALTGSSADDVKRAESRYKDLELASAQKLYSTLSSSPGADERTREFSRSRLRAVEEELRLAKGEWIALLPADEKDPNWVLNGQKLRTEAGTMEVSSGQLGHCIYSRTRVGPEFEVTGEFEVVRSSTKDFQAGLVMGLPDSRSSEWYAFRIKRNAAEGDVAAFSRQWTSTAIWQKVALDDKHNSFRFRLHDGKADAWVNGNQVLQSASPVNSLRLHPGSMVGLGAYNDMNETVIRYRNVKVRRVL